MICKIRTCAWTVNLRTFDEHASRVESLQDEILVEAKVGTYWNFKTVETREHSVKRKYALIRGLGGGITRCPE